MKQKKKKPTMKEVERVVSQLILQNQNLLKRISSLEFIVETYHEWKKDTKEFSEFLRNKVEELDKNRTNSDLSNKRPQEVSKPVQSTNS